MPPSVSNSDLRYGIIFLPSDQGFPEDPRKQVVEIAPVCSLVAVYSQDGAPPRVDSHFDCLPFAVAR